MWMLLFVWKVCWRKTANHSILSPPSYDFVMTGRTFGNAQASLALRSLILPVLLRLADVSLVAELSHLLSLGEEFLGLVRISLLN